MEGGHFISDVLPSYHKTYETLISGKRMTVHMIEPVFPTDLDRTKKKQEIEAGLYKIFSQYIPADTANAAHRTQNP